MIILLKNGSILTFKKPWHAEYVEIKPGSMMIKIRKSNSAGSIAEINYDCVTAIFTDDAVYIDMVGQEMVRNLGRQTDDSSSEG